MLATCGNTRLGGDDIDCKLAEFLSRQIINLGGPLVEENANMLARLGEAVEAAKIQLSTDSETTISLPFLTQEFSFEFVLSREQLESLSKPVIKKPREYCLKALADAGLKSNDLDQVILVGGQTRMPLVREFAAEVFGCDQGKPELNISQNPDEAVALGAAIQGGI